MHGGTDFGPLWCLEDSLPRGGVVGSGIFRLGTAHAPVELSLAGLGGAGKWSADSPLLWGLSWPAAWTSCQAAFPLSCCLSGVSGVCVMSLLPFGCSGARSGLQLSRQIPFRLCSKASSDSCQWFAFVPIERSVSASWDHAFGIGLGDRSFWMGENLAGIAAELQGIVISHSAGFSSDWLSLLAMQPLLIFCMPSSFICPVVISCMSSCCCACLSFVWLVKASVLSPA